MKIRVNKDKTGPYKGYKDKYPKINIPFEIPYKDTLKLNKFIKSFY